MYTVFPNIIQLCANKTTDKYKFRNKVEWSSKTRQNERPLTRYLTQREVPSITGKRAQVSSLVMETHEMY